jgi:hypothetical protein
VKVIFTSPAHRQNQPVKKAYKARGGAKKGLKANLHTTTIVGKNR